jgi:hypothetical protein
LTAQDTAGNSYQFSLSQLVNVNMPTITFSPSTISFSTQGVGSTSYSTYVDIMNTGSVPVSFGSITASGDFGTTSNCGTSLAVNSICTVFVTFTPTAVGTRTGTLTINDTAAGFPHLVALTGTGVATPSQFTINPTSVTFPAQGLNTRQTQTFTLYNPGSVAITISSITISGANASDFSLVSNSCGSTAPAGYYCYISITFTPLVSGVRTATAVIADNVPGPAQSVPLSGTGQNVATLSVTPTALTFAGQNLNTTSPAQSVSLGNTGTLPVNFSPIAISGANAGDFAISQNSCGTTLAAGGNYGCELSISFTPMATGTRTATLTITDNATGSPQSIALTGTGQLAVKTISLSPNPLTFSSQVVGNSSYQQGLTVTNTGSAAVTISGAVIGGANAGDFAIASNSCYGPFSVNSYCSINLVFTPSAAGARAGTLTLTDDAGNSPQTIALSGTGQAATTLTFSPAGLSFPVSATGVPVSQTITIANAGSTPAQFTYMYLGGANSNEFAITGNTCPTGSTLFGAGATCTVTISFTPANSGPQSASLTVGDNATNSPQILFLGGNGASDSPALAFTSVLVAFNNQVVGNAGGQYYLTVTNTGDASANLSSVAITGANAGDFAIVSNYCTGGTSDVLAPGGSCNLTVAFSPTAAGPRTAALTFTDNAAGSPQSVPLMGNGVALTAGASVGQEEVIFGTATVGTSVSATGSPSSISLTNTGTTPLNVSSVAITGANPSDFAITQNQCALNYSNVLPAGSLCNVTVNFAPSAAGVRSATITFTDNAPGSPQSVLLTGTGQGAAEIVTASSSLLLFGSQTVGAAGSTAQSVVISNRGTATATIGAISLSGANAGDFSITANNAGCLSGAILTAGSSCYVSLLFTPAGLGNRSAVLSVASDAPGSPLTVALSGTGIANTAALSVAPASLNFSAPTGTAAALQTVTVFNTGSSPLTVSSVMIAGPADYSLGYVSCPTYSGSSLAPGSYCTIQVGYTPSAIGATTASLGIVTSAGNQAILLNGAGQSPTKTLAAPTSVQFGNTQGVGITSLQQAVTLQNSGNEAINLSGFAISGPNAGDFSIASNSCPSALGPSLHCTLGVTFTPASTGARSASLTISDDASGSPQTIPLGGTGSATQTTLSIPTTADFGAWVLNALVIEDIPVTNTGNAPVYISGLSLAGTNPGDFAAGPTGSGGCVIPGYLYQGGTCYVAVSFTPTAVGVRSATLTFADNASGGPHAMNLVAVGQAQSSVLSFPSSISFSPTNVGGASAAQGFSITDIGNTPAYVGVFSIIGANAGDFAISQTNCAVSGPLGPNSACTVSIIFKPSAAFLRTATLQINDSTPGSPHSIVLQGAGTSTAAGVSFSPSALLDTGVATVGTTSSRLVYVSATGGTVTFTNFSILGANAGDFAIGYNYCSGSTLPAGQTCYLYVTFNPTATGVRNATLVLTDNGGAQSLPLTGLGQAATQTLLVSPATYNFGVVGVGAISSAATINVSSTGTGPVTFSNYAINGPNASDFQIAGNYCTGSALAAGFSCTLQITFTPSATGARNAMLTLTDNATGGTQSVALAGIGQNSKPLLQISPSTLAFSSPVGTGTNYNYKYVNVTNTGNVSITFSGFSLTGPNAADFTIGYNGCANLTSSGGLSAGTQCSISISFAPTIVGIETATLAVSDSTSATAQIIALVGQGQGLQKFLSVPDLLSFGAIKVGTSLTSYLSLTPVGNAAVTLSGINLSGANAGDFKLSGCTSGSIATYGCEVVVQFAPSGPGLRTAVMQLTDDASGSTQQVVLTGSGTVAGAPVSPGATTFQATAIGAPAATSYLNFANNSTSAVMISAPTVVGADAGDFAIAGTTCAGSLAAQASCSVTVAFTPTAAGPRYGAVEMAFAGSGGFPADAPIGGDGISGTGYLAIGAPGLEFDATTVNTQSSSSLSLVLRNTGQGVINLGAITFLGANAADFSQGYYTYCSKILSPGNSCNLSVQFAPSDVGLRTATLQIASDASNSPQTVSLIGIGQAAVETLSASAANVSFGSVILGGSRTSAVSVNSIGTATPSLSGIQITGDNAADFSITSAGCPTRLSYACSINLQFAPTALGVRNATLQITSDAPGSPLSIALAGVAISQTDAVTLSAVNLDFGVVSLSSQSSNSVQVTNIGTTPVNFTLPGLSGTNAGDFTITSNTCGPLLTAGAACNITMAFAPSAIGTETATLQINDDAPGGPQSVVLSGTGQVVTKMLSTSSSVVDVGLQDINLASASVSALLLSTGTGTVTISGFSITGANAADFQILSLSSCTTVSSGNACYIYLQFTPSVVGPESATLTITSDSAGGPIMMTLVGIGQTSMRNLVSSVNYLDLGAWKIGTVVSNSFQLTNTGNDTLAMQSPAISGPNAANFTVTYDTCSSTLLAGESCTVYVSFTASATGTATATLNIVSNAKNSPITVGLAGTGTLN